MAEKTKLLTQSIDVFVSEGKGEHLLEASSIHSRMLLTEINQGKAAETGYAEWSAGEVSTIHLKLTGLYNAINSIMVNDKTKHVEGFALTLVRSIRLQDTLVSMMKFFEITSKKGLAVKLI